MSRISIRAASQASASRSRLELAAVDPERVGVEDVERLAAELRQRLDDAAGRIEQAVAFVGDDDLRRARAPRHGATIWSGKWWTLTTALSTPAAASASRPRSSRVLPAIGTSGFGMVSVIGRMRLPRPAASTIAVFGHRAAHSARSSISP